MSFVALCRKSYVEIIFCGYIIYIICRKVYEQGFTKSFVAFCRKVNLPALNTAEERGRGHRGTNVIIRKSIIERGRTKYEREN